MSFSVYGTMPAPSVLRWPPYGPMQQPGGYENYTYIASAETSAGTDPIVSASLSIAPSGSGEMVCDTLYVVGQTVTAWLRGGVAGRRYKVSLILTMSSGLIIPVPIVVPIDPTLAVWPLVAAPSSGFGTPITWASGGTATGASFAVVATGLVATGTNRATAFVLPAQTNVFATVPTGTGCALNPAFVSGTCRVINTASNDLLVYPPATARIGSGAAGVAAVVSPGAGVDFATNAPATLWIAS